MMNIEEYIAKFKVNEKNALDLSKDQDLSIAVMNLISIEEHFFFSGAKTQDEKYYDLILEVRNVRKELLLKLIGKHEDGSEIWCISKHLLAASMRIMEVGTKELDHGLKTDAYGFFQKAYDIYTLFWAVNLNLVSENKEMKKISHVDHETQKKPKFWQTVIKKIVNCCLE